MGKGDAREGVRRGRMRKMPIAGLSQFGLHRYCPFSLHAFFSELRFLYYSAGQKMEKGKILSRQSDGRGFLRARRAFFYTALHPLYLLYIYVVNKTK